MASKTSAKSGGKSGGKGRRPSGKPVQVKEPKPWGSIALGVLVAVLAIGIIGVPWWYAAKENKPWDEKAAAIDGIVNYGKSKPDLLKGGQHKTGTITYDQKPPVAGPHNPTWQNCMGDVYNAPIANEHAVHSLEHGAVWVTYKQGMSKADVAKLADKVKGKDYMLLSPVKDLDKNVSLQAWGYQLKVDSVNDERIDAFIKALRKNAGPEQGAACSGGVTATGTTPQVDPSQTDAPVS